MNRFIIAISIFFLIILGIFYINRNLIQSAFREVIPYKSVTSTATATPASVISAPLPTASPIENNNLQKPNILPETGM